MEVLRGLRVAVVVVGRVGGLFKVLLVVPRVAVVMGFVVDDDVGRLVAVPDETGRCTAPGVPGLVLVGVALELSLEASGLDLTNSSPPERVVDSTGVAGGAFSSTSAGAEAMTGSASDMVAVRSN